MGAVRIIAMMYSQRLRGAAVALTAAGLVTLFLSTDAPADDAGSAPAPVTTKDMCQDMRQGYAHCHSKVVTDASGNPKVTPNVVSGYTPADLRSAYALPSTGGAGQTIAIVDAYDNPSAESDVGVYRSTFGLGTCTTSNGCFAKVNQRGQAGPYPAGDTGWGGEISLDLDMASAICPTCHILLVEADSNFDSDLDAAVNMAVALGANVVSNSWGSTEYPGETLENAAFNHPGHVITASAGDEGYVTEFPAAVPQVVAVGGTTLRRSSTTAPQPAAATSGSTTTVTAAPSFTKGSTTTTSRPPTTTTSTTRPPTTTTTASTSTTVSTSTTTPSSGRGWTESVWSGTGSGCSSYEPKPSWQHDACARRTIGDVAAVADPGTGVAVYDTFGFGGWVVFGGTSVSAPIVGAVFALAGHTSTAGPASMYASGASLFDVVTGSNSPTTTGTTTSKGGPPPTFGGCSPSYLCTAGPGYDGPTGNGTPKGIGAF